jgi:hypothetical protein
MNHVTHTVLVTIGRTKYKAHRRDRKSVEAPKICGPLLSFSEWRKNVVCESGSSIGAVLVEHGATEERGTIVVLCFAKISVEYIFVVGFYVGG